MIEITKEEFEQIMTAAIRPTTDVFDKVKPSFSRAFDRTSEKILGDIGNKLIADNSNTALISYTKTYICLYAFWLIFRQLDLVLTPTGFGVVSNNTTAPASKQRVEALYESLTYQCLQAKRDLVVSLMAHSEWGDTKQATYCVENVGFDITRIEDRLGRNLTPEEWADYRKMATAMDVRIRKMIGDAQMDDIISSFRRQEVDKPKYNYICVCIDLIMFLDYTQSREVDDKLNSLVNYMESFPDDFSIYINSEEYKTNHYERFKNKKDSPGYVFG